MADRDDYALVSKAAAEVAAPDLPYRPPRPKGRHRIALVGAGGISFAHLDAYRAHGLKVAAILSRDRAKAEARAAEFCPDAAVMTDFAALLARDDIDVIDLTPHPADRVPLIEAALRAGKHVLSQKPFVTDLGTGERLVALARDMGVHLAVNQNGRWAPHMAWMRAAATLRHAADDPDLWERLTAAASAPRTLDAQVAAHLALYRGLARQVAA
jgi:hypothetical protein